MIKKRFRLEIEFETRIDNAPVKKRRGISPEDDTKVTAFIQQFLKNPIALKSYFGSYFVDYYLQLEEDEKEPLKKLLQYENDLEVFFRSEAELCTGPVREFIKQLYEDLSPNSPLIPWQEKTREYLEFRLGHLNITNVKFDMIPPASK